MTDEKQVCPELREIARKACMICEEYNFGTQNCNLHGEGFCPAVLGVADQIIAMINPEEIRREERMKFLQAFKDDCATRTQRLKEWQSKQI